MRCEVCCLCVVLLSWLEEEAGKGPDFFLGVYSIGEAGEVVSLTSLKLSCSPKISATLTVGIIFGKWISPFFIYALNYYHYSYYACLQPMYRTWSHMFHSDMNRILQYQYCSSLLQYLNGLFYYYSEPTNSLLSLDRDVMKSPPGSFLRHFFFVSFAVRLVAESAFSSETRFCFSFTSRIYSVW